MPLPPKKDQGPILPFDPKKLPDQGFEAPDLVEPTAGWRAWSVSEELPAYGVPPKLYSVSWGYYWAPRKKAEAECAKPYPCSEPKIVKDRRTGEEHEHVIGVPGEHCSCGFYSAKTFEHLQSMGYHAYSEGTGRFTVVGKLANWGKVIEGSQGWRAQYAYPVMLYVPLEASHLALPLKEGYGVSVRLRNVLAEGLEGQPAKLRPLSSFKKVRGGE